MSLDRGSTAPVYARGSSLRGTVTGVEDADTAYVRIGSRDEKIRFYGIDAPETVLEGRPKQPYGDYASSITKSLLKKGSEVEVIAEDRDRYGRLVGRIFTLSGNARDKEVNLELVKKGGAYAYRQYGTIPTYIAAERRARASGLGVWQQPDGGVRPWDFRRGINRPPQPEAGQSYLQSILRPTVTVGNRTERGPAYLPTQLSADFFSNYENQQVKLYQNWYELANGVKPTGPTKALLRKMDRQLSDPGLGQYLNSLFGAEVYTPGQGLLGSGVALVGRALDQLTGFYYLRALKEQEQGVREGTLAEMHRSAYASSPDKGPFEQTLTFSANVIGATASSLAFYFGISHSLSLAIAHVEQKGLENLVAVSTDPSAKSGLVKSFALSAYSKEASLAFEQVGFLRQGPGLQQSSSGALDDVLDLYSARIVSAATGDSSKLDEIKDLKKRTLLGLEDDKQLFEKSSTFVNEVSTKLTAANKNFAELSYDEQLSLARQELGYDKARGVWDVTKVSRRSPVEGTAQQMRYLRDIERTLVEDLVVPIFRKILTTDQEELLQELTELSGRSVAFGFKGDQDSYLPAIRVLNYGVSRKAEIAEVLDKVAGKISANIANNFPEGREVMAQQDVEPANFETTATGKTRTIRGSGRALKHLIGIGFVDMVKFSLELGYSFRDVFSGDRTKGILQTTAEHFDAASRTPDPAEFVRQAQGFLQLQGEQRENALTSLKANLPQYTGTTLDISSNWKLTGTFAALRKGLYIAGSLFVIDRVIENYFMKPQGIDLLTQLQAEALGVFGRDEERSARQQFTGSLDAAVRATSLGLGAYIGGHLLHKNRRLFTQEGLSTAFTEEQRKALPAGFIDELVGTRAVRFSASGAMIGGLLGVIGAQTVYSAASGLFNLLFSRNSSNGLVADPEGSIATGAFGKAVHAERLANQKQTASNFAMQEVLLELSQQLLVPDVSSRRVSYSTAFQVPNPIFQLTLVAKSDPSIGVTSYSAGFQLLPMLGVGAIPTSPFGIRYGGTGRSISDQLLRNSQNWLEQTRQTEEEGYTTRTENRIRLQKARENSLSPKISLFEYIPESQMMNAFLTLGALNYIGRGANQMLAQMRRSSVVQSMPEVDRKNLKLLTSVAGGTANFAQKAVRLSQVPTLLIPNIFNSLQVFRGTSLGPKFDRTAARFLRKAGAPFLAFMAGLSLMQQASSSSSLRLLEASARAANEGMLEDLSPLVEQSDRQALYTSAVVGTVIGTSLNRVGVFERADSAVFKRAYRKKVAGQVLSNTESFQAQLYGISLEARKRGQIRFQQTQTTGLSPQEVKQLRRGMLQPKLIETMGTRISLAAPRLFKWSAITFAAGYLASSLGLLKNDGGLLSFLLDPLRLSGFDDLSPTQQALIRQQGGRLPSEASGVGGFLPAAGNFLLKTAAGIFGIGGLTGTYQDNPGMFMNLGGPFGFSESKYGAREYLQVALGFTDVSMSQTQMLQGLTTSKDSALFFKNIFNREDSSVTSLYYAAIGAQARKSPFRARGWLSSSEARALRGSPGISSGLAIRRAEVRRLTHQRPRELLLAQYFERISATALARAQGRKQVFIPGASGSLRVQASGLTERSSLDINNYLGFLFNRPSIEEDSLDDYVDRRYSQVAPGLPFLDTVRNIFDISTNSQGASPLSGFFNAALGTVALGAVLLSTISFGTVLASSALISNEAGELGRIQERISSISETVKYGTRSRVLRRRGKSSVEVLPSTTAEAVPRVLTTDDAEAINASFRNLKNNFDEAIRQQTLAAFKHSVMSAFDDLPEPAYQKYRGVLDDIADSYDVADVDTPLGRENRRLRYARIYQKFQAQAINRLEPQERRVVNHYVPKSPPSPDAPVNVRTLREFVDDLGYTGTAAAVGQASLTAAFSLANFSNIYSTLSGLTQTATNDPAARSQASFYTSTKLTETAVGFMMFPVFSAISKRLALSGGVAAVGVLGYLADQHFFKGSATSAVAGGISYASKNFYDPLRYGLSKVLQYGVNTPVIQGLFSVASLPFKALDPLLATLYNSTQTNPALALLGNWLLPEPMESFFGRQEGLFPGMRSIQGQRFENYTASEVKQYLAYRDVIRVRSAQQLDPWLAEDIVNPALVGRETGFMQRVRSSRLSNTAGYATRVLASSNEPMQLSNILLQSLYRRQAMVDYYGSTSSYRAAKAPQEDIPFAAALPVYLRASSAKGNSIARTIAITAEGAAPLWTGIGRVLRAFDLSRIPVGRAASYVANRTKQLTARSSAKVNTPASQAPAQTAQPGRAGQLARGFSKFFALRTPAIPLAFAGSVLTAVALKSVFSAFGGGVDRPGQEQLANIGGVVTGVGIWALGDSINKAVYKGVAQPPTKGVGRFLDFSTKASLQAVRSLPAFAGGAAVGYLLKSSVEYLYEATTKREVSEEASVGGSLAASALGGFAAVGFRGRGVRAKTTSVFSSVRSLFAKNRKLGIGVGFAAASVVGSFALPPIFSGVRDFVTEGGIQRVLPAIGVGALGILAYAHRKSIEKFVGEASGRLSPHIAPKLSLAKEKLGLGRLAKPLGALAGASVMPALAGAYGFEFVDLSSRSTARQYRSAYTGLAQGIGAALVSIFSRGRLSSQVSSALLMDSLIQRSEYLKSSIQSFFEADQQVPGDTLEERDEFIRSRNTKALAGVVGGGVAIGLAARGVTSTLRRGAAREARGALLGIPASRVNRAVVQLGRGLGQLVAPALTAFSVMQSLDEKSRPTPEYYDPSDTARATVRGVLSDLSAASFASVGLPSTPASKILGVTAGLVLSNSQVQEAAANFYAPRLARAGLATRAEAEQFRSYAGTGSRVGAVGLGIVGGLAAGAAALAGGALTVSAVVAAAPVILLGVGIGALVGLGVGAVAGMEHFIRSRDKSGNKAVSLFSRPARAATLEEELRVAENRRKGIVGTFTRQKTDRSRLPSAKDVAAKQEDERPWWKKLLDNLTSLWRSTSGRILSAAQDKAGEFLEGAAGFFLGEYGPDMAALAAISALESGSPQGRANVAQSILNRRFAAETAGLNFLQKDNRISSLIIAPGQYQPVRDGGSRSIAAFNRAAATGSADDYITAMMAARGWTRQRASAEYYSSLSAISDPKRQAEARRVVGPRTDFESVASHAENKRGGIKKVNDGHGHIFGFYMGPGSISYGRSANQAAPFPSREANLMERMTGFGGVARTGVVTSPKGGGTPFHMHMDFGHHVSTTSRIQMLDQMARGYASMGRVIEFSNAGVSGLRWNPNASAEQKESLLRRAIASHSKRSRDPIDFYVPKIGAERSDVDTGRSRGSGPGGQYVEYLAPVIPGGRLVIGSWTKDGVPIYGYDSQNRLVYRFFHAEAAKSMQNRTIRFPARGATTPTTRTAIPPAPPKLPVRMNAMASEVVTEAVIAAASEIPEEELRMLREGVEQIKAQAEEQVRRAAFLKAKRGVVINPENHLATPDSTAINSDALQPRKCSKPVPFLEVAAQSFTKKVEVRTTEDYSVYLNQLSNGGIPLRDSFAENLEPDLVGARGSGAQTPFGVVLSTAQSE